MKIKLHPYIKPTSFELRKRSAKIKVMQTKIIPNDSFFLFAGNNIRRTRQKSRNVPCSTNSRSHVQVCLIFILHVNIFTFCYGHLFGLANLAVKIDLLPAGCNHKLDYLKYLFKLFEILIYLVLPASFCLDARNTLKFYIYKWEYILLTIYFGKTY